MGKMVEVLAEWDCNPLSHIWEENGRLFYCHWVGEDRWLAKEVAQTQIDALKQGGCDIRSLLTGLGIMLWNYDKETWGIPEEKDLEGIPDPGVFLYPEHSQKFKQSQVKISDNVLIRLNSDGTLDEIVTYDPNGECDLHLEQMDDNLYWMRFYATKSQPTREELIVWIGAEAGLKLEYEFDPVGRPSTDEYLPEDRKFDTAYPKLVESVVMQMGMQRLLEELISNTERAKKNENELHPERNTDYLDRLRDGFVAVLEDYKKRHEDEEV